MTIASTGGGILRKVIGRKPREVLRIGGARKTAPGQQGYEKLYVCNDNTGRPNQVFVCLTCRAQRPKLSKMMKHLNVHKKNQPAPSTPAQINLTSDVPPRLPHISLLIGSSHNAFKS